LSVLKDLVVRADADLRQIDPRVVLPGLFDGGVDDVVDGAQ